jgi:hypothetical protein
MMLAMEKLYAGEAAERAGIARSTWTTYASRRLPLSNPVPEPSGTDIEGGHARPWWTPKVVDEWRARRPGKGGRPRKS